MVPEILKPKNDKYPKMIHIIQFINYNHWLPVTVIRKSSSRGEVTNSMTRFIYFLNKPFNTEPCDIFSDGAINEKAKGNTVKILLIF